MPPMCRVRVALSIQVSFLEISDGAHDDTFVNGSPYLRYVGMNLRLEISDITILKYCACLAGWLAQFYMARFGFVAVLPLCLIFVW